MAFVYRICARRPIFAAAVAAAMAAGALIPGGLAQGNPAASAEGQTTLAGSDNAPGAAVGCENCNAGRQAADDANKRPSAPTEGITESRKRALVLLMLASGGNRPFGFFK